MNERFGISNKVKFDAEANSFGKFEKWFNFLVLGKFPDICGNSQIVKYSDLGGFPGESVLSGPKLYSCRKFEDSYLVAYDRYFLPETR